ncbi:MAG: hypothetical protein HYX90_06145 [Chloroflexi bacterium]|nr:hypothetical protein [Chloroflexota bacterium]
MTRMSGRAIWAGLLCGLALLALFYSTAIADPAPTSTTIGKESIDEKGVVLRPVSLASSDNLVRIDIASGTRAVDKSGRPIVQLQILPLQRTPPLPTGVVLAAYEFQPSDASFGPPARLTFGFDVRAIPRGYTTESLAVAFYDAASGSWVEQTGAVDTRGNNVSALVNRFGIFGLVVKGPDSSVAVIPIERAPVIDRVIEKAIYAVAATIGLIASAIALVVVLLMRRGRKKQKRRG